MSASESKSSRWASVAVTLAIAAIAVAVQWGAINANARSTDKRLDEFKSDFKSDLGEVRQAISDVNKRLSFIEGSLRK